MMARTHATPALLMPVAVPGDLRADMRADMAGCRPGACCLPQHPAA